MVKSQSPSNPYGKNGNFAVKQIIDRVLAENFSIGKKEQKSIGEIQDEMLRLVAERAKVVDFAKGETCEFK